MTDTMDSFVNVKPVIVADAPDAHQVWLDIGVQHFTVGEYCETKEDAEWHASQLRIALANTASPSSRGEAVVNQCDGCVAGYPIENGIHRFPFSTSNMVCQAEKYKDTAPGVVAGEVTDERIQRASALAADLLDESERIAKLGNESSAFVYRSIAKALTAAIGRG